MFTIIFGIFLILHGLVHLLYFGQSYRYFELKPGMLWPDGAWTFSKLLGDETTRTIAGILLVLAALGFIAGGIGTLAKISWWRPLVTSTAVFSSAIFILFWDGTFQNLDGKGFIGVLINAAVLAIVMIFRW